MINGKVIKAIIPARMTSSRLPGKVMLDICGKPALQRVIERVKAAKLIDGVVIATTINKQDDEIEEFCKSIGCECTRGSENDVLDRTVKSALESGTDVIVDITSDCPLIYWEHIDTLIEMHMNNDADLTTNILTRTYPRGYDIRILDTKTLQRVQNEVDNDIDRQHAFTWMYLNPKGKQGYTVQNMDAPCEEFRPDIEVTLDTPEDYELIKWIYGYESGYNMQGLTCREVINLISGYPTMYNKVSNIQRKDYFQELEECYAKQNNKSEEKEDVQCADNRVRKTGRRGRPAKK